MSYGKIEGAKVPEVLGKLVPEKIRLHCTHGVALPGLRLISWKKTLCHMSFEILVFESFFVILSAIYFLLKAHLL